MATIEDLTDLFGDPDNPDPLHPDLVSSVHEEEGSMPVLKHPLVFQVPYAPMLNRISNRSYTAKKEACEVALTEKNWSKYVFLHERPYRLDAFLEIEDEMTDEEYWELLIDIWTDTENYYQNCDAWQEAFSSARPGRELLMTDEERTKLAGLTNPAIVHRGFSVDNAEVSLSWTLSYEKAKWFALRHVMEDEHARVATTHLDKDQIIAYKMERGEDEVIILPENLLGAEIVIEDV